MARATASQGFSWRQFRVMLHVIRKGEQISDVNVREIRKNDPHFDFEEYFLQHERQD